MGEHFKYSVIILFLIAFVATSIVFKPILKIAKGKNIVDNPNARKLQESPVPVMGGIAVFFGIVVGICFFKAIYSFTTLFPVLGAMIIMLYLGFIDDVISIKAWVRFVIEMLIGVLLIYGLRVYISDFQGLFGIENLPLWLGIFLSALTFVGIVNAVNMIDGIDGLASAFCILIMGCFGIICFLAHEFSFAALSAVCIGAILPFFLHNVFGWNSKMFIGDGGTMMIGTAISAMVFEILKKNFPLDQLLTEMDFSRIAFVLAVMSIPIFDTLRVMIGRIARHRSPFEPDKTHLHHVFLSIGYSFIGITIIEISLDILIIMIFAAVWLLGGSLFIQLIAVVVASLLADFGIVRYITSIQKKGGRSLERAKRFAENSHVERTGIWLVIQKLIDGRN